MEREVVEAVRGVIAGGEPIVALTGAGVSAESGIPTFRGAGGLWRGFRAEELATPGAFARDPERVWDWYRWRRTLVLDADPNPAHEALAAFEHAYSAFTLITQNVDGLHQRAGSPRVLKLHGNLHCARCTRCEFRQESSTEDPPLPTCRSCGGRTRPDVVWFGESLPEGAWIKATQAAASARLHFVIGTSAAVYPAAGLIESAAHTRTLVVEVNPQATALSELADFVVRENAGTAMPQLLRVVEGSCSGQG